MQMIFKKIIYNFHIGYRDRLIGKRLKRFESKILIILNKKFKFWIMSFVIWTKENTNKTTAEQRDIFCPKLFYN